MRRGAIPALLALGLSACGGGSTASGPSDLATGLPAVEEVRVVGDVEGTVDVAIGLTRGVCPTVSMALGPSRLVVDVPSG